MSAADVVAAVRAAAPGLGEHVVVLRPDARALDSPERFAPDALAWIDAHAPGARLARVTVPLAAHPAAEPAQRTLTVAAFPDARGRAAFTAAWTGEPPTAGLA